MKPWNEMTPRERDALVAEKVLGIEVFRNKKGGWSEGEPNYYDDAGCTTLSNPLKAYSTEIEHAWKVVEHLAKDAWVVETITSENGGTDVKLNCTAGARGRYFSDVMDGTITTASYAICMAALKALGIKT